jgi:hypothetical protein
MSRHPAAARGLQVAEGSYIAAYGLAKGRAYRAVVGETFLPFRNATPKPMTEARSTLIVSGIQTLRASADGLYERYVELLSPKLRQDIMALVAGLWIPGELALEHYRTMDRLQLSKSAIEAIGAEVAERGAKTVLLRRAARQGDATPWDRLGQSHRNLDINWRGSDIMISKEGPQEALFLWAGQPCAGVPYFVTSWGSFLRAVVTSGGTTATHRILYDQCSATTIAIHLAWL